MKKKLKRVHKILLFKGQTNHTTLNVPSVPWPEKGCSPKSMDATHPTNTHVWLHTRHLTVCGQSVLLEYRTFYGKERQDNMRKHNESFP